MENRVVHRHISLAVLPFQVLTEDTAVEMFCQGLVMDLITDLSRFRPFHIIAYDTARGLPPDEQPGSPRLHDLDLDYLVRGMARQHKDTLAFNLQLVNARQNRLVWAEKLSGTFDELFHLQEEMAEKIVVSLQHFVDHDLMSVLRQKPLTSLGAARSRKKA